MKIKHCPTESMVADILTKPIVGSQFKKLAMKLLGYEHPAYSSSFRVGNPAKKVNGPVRFTYPLVATRWYDNIVNGRFGSYATSPNGMLSA